MNKRLISTLLTMAIAVAPACVSAYEKPLDVRAIQSDSYFTPYHDAGNPYVTHYAPWLRNFHLMTAEEAENLKANGLPGGEANQQVRMLEISPKNNDIMYFITNTSGIYKTENGGKFWYNTTNNMRGNDARGLWCDIFDESTVYASLRRDGFYRSTDKGKSWELILEDLDDKQSHRDNTITQDTEGNTYFAASSGIYRLNRDSDNLELLLSGQTLIPDGGGSISENPTIGPLWWDIEVSADGRDIYASVATHKNSVVSPGLYMSHDAGKTWTTSTLGESPGKSVYSIALHPEYSSTNKKFYVSALKSYGTVLNCRFFITEDGGNNFSYSNPGAVNNCDFYGMRFGPKNSNGIYPLYFSATKKAYPLFVTESYDNGNFSLSVSNVFTAEDDITAGTIRDPENGSFTGYLYQALAPDMTEPGRLVFGSAGIHERTADGTFNRISGGFSGSSVTGVTFDSGNRPFFVVTDRGSYAPDGSYTQNVDGTSDYPTFNRGVEDIFTTAKYNPENDMHIVAYLGKNNGISPYYAIRQSFDGGLTFNDIEEDANIPVAEGIDNNTVIRFDGDNIYTSYFTSHDSGETWERNMHGDEEIFIYAISKTNPKLMLGTTSRLEKDDGSENKTTVLYKSADGGETWTNIGDEATTLTLGTGPAFGSAEFDIYGENGEDDGEWVWMVKMARVYRVNIETGESIIITDGTNKPATGLIPDRFEKIAQNPNNPNHILLGTRPNATSVGTDNKLSESYDGGLTWHTVPGLWGAAINSITFVPGTTEVFIGTMGGIMIYDYEKYNYYAGVQLTAEGQSPVWVHLERVNADRVNRNNGEYIVAPENPFTLPVEKIFKSWKYNGNSYLPGELILLD